ncbi:DUF3105 domain-containing protein [Baekduia sp. Peel2402]|uniref:DUF3105 domain-containing protein n=1 Tax=Baekduia sp. Peel2402 TaxID=3458296 RepID=UPI00403E7615
MPLDRRALLFLLAVPLVALVVGLLTIGADAKEPTAAASAGASCTQHALKYTVTDSAAEFNRQKAFEATAAAITEPGFYAAAPPSTATLHAASHGSVVVYYRPGLSAAQLAPLHALMDRASATKAPVIVAPRRQAEAVTALVLGTQIDCSAADAAQIARVRAFAATFYASLKA